MTTKEVWRQNLSRAKAGHYCIMADAAEAKVNGYTMPPTYNASSSTGVYGSYQIRQFEYKPSFSTGIYGSYQIISTQSQPTIINQPTKKQEKKEGAEEEEEEETTIIVKRKIYTYYPSISSGVFGTWIYNKASPFTIKEITKTVKTKRSTSSMISKRGGMKISSGYSSYYSRKKQAPKEYKFEILGPRLNEKIKNGKKFNVKLLQEYILSMGPPLAEHIKQLKAQKKKASTKQNDDEQLIISQFFITYPCTQCYSDYILTERMMITIRARNQKKLRMMIWMRMKQMI